MKTSKKNEFKIEERPLPELKYDELLIKVEFCGVCGSDIHAAALAPGYEFVPKPIIFGHEFTGTVVEVGNQENAHYENKRIIGIPGLFCHECEQCKIGNLALCEQITLLGLHHDGAMAQYVKVKDSQIIVIPENLSSELGALTEPLSVAVHAVERIKQPLDQKQILVQGCGIIGIFTALVASLKGAEVTISGLEKDWTYRLSLAKKLGLRTEIVGQEGQSTEKMDYIFECSGASVAAEHAVNRVKKGSTIILVALYEQPIKFPVNLMVRGQIDLLTSYGYTIEGDFYESIHLLQKHQQLFEQLYKIYPLNKGELAFIEAREQKVLKPILQM